MSTALACFLIAIITGLFFGAGFLLIRSIKPRDASKWPEGEWTGDIWKTRKFDPTNTGAVEGNLRDFRDHHDGD